MNVEQIKTAIIETGFPLEHKTSESFRERGWNVISNKYYLDDKSGEAREIDLIAYKSTLLQDVRVFYGIIVSCKKKNDNAWAFLTCKSDLENTNIDWFPVHSWTNLPPLSCELSRPEFGKEFTERLGKRATHVWGIPDRAIFAFQELAEQTVRKNETRVTARNDTAIYSSLSSLMKAQAYEADRLKDRKPHPVVYFFSLLSVHDGDMFAVNFDKPEPSVEKCDFHSHIAHYIISRKEQFSRINFVHADTLARIIEDSDKAHEETVECVKDSLANFYRNVLADEKKIKVFEDRFRKWVYPSIKRLHPNPDLFRPEDIFLSSDNGVAEVTLSDVVQEDVLERLNDDKHVGPSIGRALKAFYRYEGEFRFVSDIPF